MKMNRDILKESILENKDVFTKNGITSVSIFGPIAQDKFEVGQRIEVVFTAEAEKGKDLMMMLYQRELILEVLNVPGLEAHHYALLKQKIKDRLKDEEFKIY
ncbi:MAG: hypothetical protein KAG04_02245 [Mycoplasmataceae bacterium]|nr:hypothetical protein [Mycoplasmataceae bacterium]